ncbi:MAG: MotA/TolQ/ExbB proton channel family protein [Verrucomicrobiia bacterium]
MSPATKRIRPLGIVIALICFALGLISNPSHLYGQGVLPSAPALAKAQSIWDIVKHGGPVLIILGLCSVLCLTLMIERYMYYRKATGNMDEMLLTIKRAGSITDALAAIDKSPGIAGHVFRMALTAARDGYQPKQVERLVEGAVTKEMIQMEKFLPQLDTLVTLCPLLGLFGTTLGMIRSFSIVAAIGMKNPEMLAGGISEALVNTAAGLGVALPALFAFNYFAGKKEAIVMDLERGLTELMVIIESSHGG